MVLRAFAIAMAMSIVVVSITAAGVVPPQAEQPQFDSRDQPFFDYVAFDRFAGPNRYATAAAVSANHFNPGVPAVFIATGQNFPDALAAGAAAAKLGAPVLLVKNFEVPSETYTELTRLAPQAVYIAGGPGVVSVTVEGIIRTHPSIVGKPVARLWGTDRYATAADIATKLFSPGVPTAYIATGLNFPDALAGVPASGVSPGPILLARRDSVPAPTQSALTHLRPQQIVILGGTGVISDAVAAELQRLTGAPVVRRAGVDRYATAVSISQWAFPDGAEVVYLAIGRNYPDALAGGPAATVPPQSPLLLIDGGTVPSVVVQELQRLHPEFIYLLGGTGVIPDSVMPTVESALGFRSFGEGDQIVGTTIAPGIYAADGGPSCYWERLSGFSGSLDEVIANDFDTTNPVVEIAATDRGFSSSGCGPWSNNLVPLYWEWPTAFDEGTVIVGHDIPDGTYQAPGGTSCYWERLSGFSGEFKDIIANDFDTTNPVVTIAATDAAFRSDNCGTWQPVP